MVFFSYPKAEKSLSFIVGLGPSHATRACEGFPRHRPRNPAIAGDRPPHYDKKNGSQIIAGDRPPRYDKKRPLTVGRGPVPRHAAVYRTVAGDRSTRYDNGKGSWAKNGPPHRRARACPSPIVRAIQRSRETGTTKKTVLRSVGPECL